MAEETVAEADCVLCGQLDDPGERMVMRADLREMPFLNVCDRCQEAFWTNVIANSPKTEEERMSRRAERAARGE